MEKKNGFFSDKKNIAITILSILVIILFLAYPSGENKEIIEASSTVSSANLEEEITTLSNELTEAQGKIKSLEENNQILSEEKEDLTAKLQTIEELQKTVDEKNQYIFNLEAQVGTLTAEKTQLESQNGILQQQLNSKPVETSSSGKSSSSTSAATSSSTDTSYTVYITDTGSKYHRSGCSYLRSSSHAIDKNSAVSRGYTACSRCSP